MKKILFMATFVALLSSCAADGIFQKEKKYSPVYLYYNPIDPDILAMTSGSSSLMPSMIYPQFVNYPTDCVKFGLRGSVSKIKYTWSHKKGVVEMAFDNKGRLRYVYTGAAPYDEAEDYYMDNQDRFCAVTRRRGNSVKQTLEYDATDKVTKRNFRYDQIEFQTYNYYEDGTLKEITPVMRKSYKNKKSNITGKMEFKESGELVMMVSNSTNNPFVHSIGDEFPDISSISTFKYAENGLCTEKLEKLLLKNSKGNVDTIPCLSQYTYNENGDIEKLFYNGIYRRVDNKDRNNYRYRNILSSEYISDTLSIRYTYKYDEHNNWTTMNVMLPNNIFALQMYPLLRLYSLLSTENINNYYLNPSEIFPGIPTITFNREVEYHAQTAEEAEQAHAEEIKKNTPKFTAVQGCGLYGRVKSVTSKDYNGKDVTMRFNEYGNITNDGYNEYEFSSSTEYACGVIGPFKILCEGNIRKEVDKKGVEGNAEYEFDARGRVIRHKKSAMYFTEEKFVYEGKDKHPVKSITEVGDSEGTCITINKYTYVAFDEQGNWIKRKVNSSWENEEYLHDENDTSEKSTGTKPEYVETRTITYYK